MFNKFFSRKLLVSMVLLIVGTIIDLKTERGLSVNMLNLLLFICGVFTTGNVASDAIKAYADKRAASAVDAVSEHKKTTEAQMQELVTFVTAAVTNQNEVLKKVVDNKRI